MNKYQMPMILGIVGGILALIGTILPWVDACVTLSDLALQCKGESGLADVGPSVLSPILSFGGTLALVFGIIGLVMMVLRRSVTSMVATVMGLLVLVVALLFMMQIDALEAWWNAFGGPLVTISPGIGLYLSMIGGLLLIIGGFLDFSRRRT